MPTALLIELRQRIVAAYERGEGTYEQIAQRFQVGVASVNRYVNRSRRGELSPAAHGGGRVALIGPNYAQVLTCLARSDPDTSAQELADKWKRHHGVLISVSAMKRAMHRFGLTYKKAFRASEQLRESVQQEHEVFKEIVRLIPKNKLVFLDETSCNTAMARRSSWSLRGIQAVADKPINHGDNITVLSAIRLRGTVALRSYRGATNSRRFVQWFSKVLLPRLSRDDVVVMDNLRAHHASDLTKAAHKVGVHILYLPPYSPDLNPIKMLRNVFKRQLEKLTRRTTRAFKQAIRTTWAAFRNREFGMMFEACGYK